MKKQSKAKNNTSHVGFRNEDLFCFHCGRSQKIPYPITSTMMLAMTNAFVKDHEYCKKTWHEPVPSPDGKSEIENALWWANPKNGEHGISSKTIFNRLIEDKRYSMPNPQGESHPYDPDDFRRCYLLLKAVPQFKAKLYLMKPLSAPWSNLVDNWDRLEQMLEEQMQGNVNNMYEEMQKLIK